MMETHFPHNPMAQATKSTSQACTCSICCTDLSPREKDWMEWKGVDYCEECWLKISKDDSGERMAMDVEMNDYNKGL